MSDKFLCKYCGSYKSWDDRDYDMGLYLAECASYEALGHAEYVMPYLICTDCSKEIKESNNDY